MNEILQAKLNELKKLEKESRWYIVRQETDFVKTCYLVSIFEEYKKSKKITTEKLKNFVQRRESELSKEKSIDFKTDYRNLLIAAYYGLIIYKENRYENSEISTVFYEIKERCDGNFEKIDLYKDIIERQIEKLFTSSKLDTEYKSNRANFRLFPIMFLYKILLELGKSNQNFEISIVEFYTLVITTQKYEDYLDTLLFIKLLRNDSDAQTEFKKIVKKFSSEDRLLLSLQKNFEVLEITNTKIELKQNRIKEVYRKVFLFEQSMKNFDENEYIDFLCSQNHIVDTSIPHPYNRILFGAPGTGKSHRLLEQSSLFKNQITRKLSSLEQIKNEIQNAKTKLDCNVRLYAIGIKYYNELNGKNRNELKEFLRMPNNILKDYGPIYYGWNAKNALIDIKISEGQEFDYELIKNYIDAAVNKKNNNMEIRLIAIGFKFSDYFIEKTASEIESLFPNLTNAYYIKSGAQASRYLEEDTENTQLVYIERVTFHPNYSYANFVGTYKPVQSESDNSQIQYKYVPGPFMRTYAKAIKNSNQNFLLIIEEINRANVAAVFGDVFQLLDRQNGVSEFAIAASEDIKKYLHDEGIQQNETLCIPSNMYIWATMNSADQGVFPMDTAFKRRWEFEYIGIDEIEESDDEKEKESKDFLLNCEIPLPNNQFCKWNKLRKAINNKLVSLKVPEDKLLGPFFISKNNLESATLDGDKFIKLFKSKVIMYLFEDVVKMKPSSFFKVESEKYVFSEISKEFNLKGLQVFDLQNEVEVISKEK